MTFAVDNSIDAETSPGNFLIICFHETLSEVTLFQVHK